MNDIRLQILVKKTYLKIKYQQPRFQKVNENKNYLVNGLTLNGSQINQIRTTYNREKNNVFVFSLNQKMDSSETKIIKNTMQIMLDKYDLYLNWLTLEMILNKTEFEVVD